MSSGGFSAAELSNVKSVLSSSAESYVNNATLEMSWAIKAYEHAETYFNLITAVDPTLLRLTQADDAIYKAFREGFPDLKVEIIIEDEIKSAEGKEKWREFCNKFEGAVQDWNMATLLRLDSKDNASEKNTTVVPRIQFLAIEIARNREGHNSNLRERFPAKGKRDDKGQ